MTEQKEKTGMTTTPQPLLAAVVLLGLTISLSACGQQSGGSFSPPPPAAAGSLSVWRFAGSIEAADLNKAIAAAGLSGITAVSAATCYKLTYGTPDVAGSLINASGLVCLPETRSGGSAVVSFQHGTIFQDSEAPSGSLSGAAALTGIILSGLGYIAVLPDYIGYGDSTDRPHPYLHAATLASSVVDMNRAARVFFADPAINAKTNGRFFLAGYSEGGYATLAAQRLMEQSLAGEFPVTASEAGAGPYDLSATTGIILGFPNQPQPALAGFFLKTYDGIYNSPSRLTAYFAAPYADIARTHYDGSFSKSQIDGALGGIGVITKSLFTPSFLADYLNAGEAALKAHIAENNVYDWKPGVPTRLFHGVDDDVVPYVNTIHAKTAMDANGSTTVTVVDCDAGAAPASHENCVRPFTLDMLTFFQTLATGL